MFTERLTKLLLIYTTGNVSGLSFLKYNELASFYFDVYAY